MVTIHFVAVHVANQTTVARIATVNIGDSRKQYYAITITILYIPCARTKVTGAVIATNSNCGNNTESQSGRLKFRELILTW